MRDPICIILVGVFVGGVLGSLLFNGDSRRQTSIQLSELWERFKPTADAESKSARIPEGWGDHYRRAPDGRSPPLETTAPVAQARVADVRFSVCASAVRVNCVVDGDTLWLGGQKIRIADINTPEMSSPKCAHEKALGHKAKHRLVELLNAGPFQVARTGVRDRDRYGRLLRLIVRDGQSLGMILVSEGLARVWHGSKQSWCET